MNAFQSFLAFLGRVCLSLIFLLSAIKEILNWQVTEQYLLSSFSQWMTYYQTDAAISSFFAWLLPWLPFLLLLGVACKILGSLLVIIGWKVRLGAFFLIVFIVPSTILMHHFWGVAANEKPLEMIMFMKNLGLFGGLLILLAFGKGFKRKDLEVAQED